MRESPVPPEVSVADAKSKSNDIEIRDDGAKRTGHPDTLRDTRVIEARSNAESSHCV